MTRWQLLAAAAAVKKLVADRLGGDMTEVLLAVRRHDDPDRAVVVNALVKHGAVEKRTSHGPGGEIVSAVLEVDGVTFRAQYSALVGQEPR